MLDLGNLGIYRENNRIEAKKAQGGLPHSIWETYSAFANSFGGVILLGVVERGDKTLETVPLPDPEALVDRFWELLDDRSQVSANILTHRDVYIAQSGGNPIVVIEVPRAGRHDKPVYIGPDPCAGSYRRSGEGDYRCTPEEVRNMLRDREDVSQDTRVPGGFTLDSLDPGSLERYRLRMAAVCPGHLWESLGDGEFLQRIGAAGQDGEGRTSPTAGGLLMFGRHGEILREYPAYRLEYQERPDLLSPWSRRILSGDEDWSGNVHDFFFLAREALTRDLPPAEGGGEESPVARALGEALANALIHADYRDRRGLLIQRTRDRVVIQNPGAFRVDVGEAVRGGVSDPRNAALLKMFRLIRIGEGSGGGLPRILSAWASQGWSAPRIAEELGPDRTILSLPLRRAGARPGPGARKQAILEFLTDTPAAPPRDIAAGVGIPPAKAREYLLELASENAVVEENGLYRLRW